MSAPAGYGKTATLASWAAGHRDRVAWLSCDPTDAEPTRFMSCLLSAISATWPGVADDAFVLLEREGANTYDAAVAVANELATRRRAGRDRRRRPPPGGALPRPCSTAFIDALPDGFRFVAGTRSDPPLSLARLRLRGELLELRGDDLRFGAAEMADFFALHDVPLTSDELLRLHELTEGWPAGAQLAAIALQRGAAARRLPGGVRQHRPGRRRLPAERGAGEPAARARRLPRRDVGARRLRCRAVRGRHRRTTRPAAVLERLARRQPVRGAARTTGRAGTATTTCSAPSCAPGWRRWAAPGSRRPTTGRRGPSRSAATSPARCGTRWRSATSSGPGRSSGRRSAGR